MAVGSITTRTVKLNVERHNTKTAPGDTVIAREYVYPESGDPQTIYFVTVEGTQTACEGTSQHNPARNTESSRDDICVLSRESGGEETQGGVPDEGARGEGDIEAPCQWEDSSDNNDDDYLNSLLESCDASESHSDSSSDYSPSWQDYSRVGPCAAHWMMGGMESDDSEGSGGGSSGVALS